jgi:hypothetical protein
MDSLRLPLLACCALFALLAVPRPAASAQAVAADTQSASPAPLVTNAPAPDATSAPTEEPAASPAPQAKPAHAKRARADAFIQYENAPFEYVDNFLANGVFAYGTSSGALGTRIPAFGQTLLFDGEFHAGVVRTAGGGSLFLPALTAHEYAQDYRAAVLVAKPDIYVGTGVYYRPTIYGFPILVGEGYGAEKLPEFDRSTSTFGRIYFYPNINNEHPFFDTASGRPLGFRYSILRYQGGDALRVGHSNGFLTAALDGQRFWRIADAPSNEARIGVTLGYMLNVR